MKSCSFIKRTCIAVVCWESASATARQSAKLVPWMSNMTRSSPSKTFRSKAASLTRSSAVEDSSSSRRSSNVQDSPAVSSPNFSMGLTSLAFGASKAHFSLANSDCRKCCSTRESMLSGQLQSLLSLTLNLSCMSRLMRRWKAFFFPRRLSNALELITLVLGPRDVFSVCRVRVGTSLVASLDPSRL